MTTYELTTNTREDFENVKTQLISDFIEQFTGAEVTNQLLGKGKIVSCDNMCNNPSSLVVTVHFDLDETKNYGLVAALTSGGLKLVDESMLALYLTFMAEHDKVRTQYNIAREEALRRQKEEEKKAKQKEAREKKKAEAANKQAEK